MPAYSFTQSVADTAQLLQYIQKSLPTAQSATNDGTSIKIATSTTLTTGDQTILSALMASYPDPVTGKMDSGVNISLYNSSRLALGSSAVFTGQWEDVSRYSTITITGLSDQASAVNGLSIQFGVVSAQADITRTYTTAANTSFSNSLTVPGRFFRLVYTNGSVAQSAFSLQVKWSVVQVSTIVTGTDIVNDALSAQLTRSMVVARQDIGTFAALRVDEDGKLRVKPAASSNVVQSGSTPIVQASYTYTVNTDTNVITTTGSGAVTSAVSRAIVSSGAATTSSAVLTTRRYASCPAGQNLRVLLACSFTTGVVGNTQIVGIGTSTNGLFFGYNGTSFGILVRTDGVDTWTASTAFSVDKLNGSGSSGLTLDPTKGSLYVIALDSTGYGCATFCIVSNAMSASPEVITAHRINFANTSTTLGIRNAVGPLMVASTNTTNATAVTVGVASLSAALDNPPKRIGNMRAVDGSRTIQTLSYVPVLSVQNKSTYNSLPNTSSMYLSSVSVASDGTKGTVLVALYDTTALTGSTFADVSTLTSVAQADTAATALSGGVLLHAFTVYTTGNVTVDLSNYNIIIPPGSSLTIAAKVAVNGASDLVSATLTWTEEG
jgi:hypothetical protein